MDHLMDFLFHQCWVFFLYFFSHLVFKNHSPLLYRPTQSLKFKWCKWRQLMLADVLDGSDLFAVNNMGKTKFQFFEQQLL